MPYSYREAHAGDIPQMQQVRASVPENRLSNPGKVTHSDVLRHITRSGKGWVCISGDSVFGFAIVNVETYNIWALFVEPGSVSRGIGRTLHDIMVNWYFGQSHTTLWLGTEPHTRAARFYRKAGWKESGSNGPDEIRFELTYQAWLRKSNG